MKHPPLLNLRGAVMSALWIPLALLAASAAEGATVAIRDDGVVRVNGESFFPYGFYTDEKYDKAAMFEHARVTGRAGFNVIHVEPIDNDGLDALFAEAQANGQYVIYGPWKGIGFANLHAVYDKVKNHPALLGYNVGDDVNDGEMVGYPANLADVKALHDDLRSYDPGHITMAALGGPGGQIEVFSEKRFDAGARQIYPINGGSRIRLVYEIADSIVASAARFRQSPWIVLQTFDWNGNPNQRMPTFAEYYNMLYQSIAAGVKGVMLYSYHVGDVGADSDPELWAGLASTTPEIAAIKDFLTDGTITRTEFGNGLYASTWQYQGRVLVIVVHAGDYRSVLDPAANPVDRRTVSLALPPGTSGTLRPAFANRTTGMALVQGKLEGTIDLLDVHAYIIDTTPAPGPSAMWSGTRFEESVASDGSVSTVLTVTLSNASFSGSEGDDLVAGGKVLVSNLPAGLQAITRRISSTQVTLTLAGRASAHANADDVHDLSVTFAESALVGGGASAVSGLTVTDLRIDFSDPGAAVPAPVGPQPGTTAGGKRGCGLGSGFTLFTLVIAAAALAHTRSRR